jgi:hypothetical protein
MWEPKYLIVTRCIDTHFKNEGYGKENLWACRMSSSGGLKFNCPKIFQLPEKGKTGNFQKKPIQATLGVRLVAPSSSGIHFNSIVTLFNNLESPDAFRQNENHKNSPYLARQ